MFYMTGKIVSDALAQRSITDEPYLWRTGMLERTQVGSTQERFKRRHREPCSRESYSSGVSPSDPTTISPFLGVILLTHYPYPND